MHRVPIDSYHRRQYIALDWTFAIKTSIHRSMWTLVEKVILRYGCPRRIIFDNGPQFISLVIQKIGSPTTLHSNISSSDQTGRSKKPALKDLTSNLGGIWPHIIAKPPAIHLFCYEFSTRRIYWFIAAYFTFGRKMRIAEEICRDLRTIVSSKSFIPKTTPKFFLYAEQGINTKINRTYEKK